MRRFLTLFTIAPLLLPLGACGLIGGAIKLGLWLGIILVLIIVFATMLGRRGRRNGPPPPP